jgi:hypothetical protein
MSWINLSALWKIVVFGLIAGAGLPAIFAGGLYALSLGPRTHRVATAGGDADAGDSDVLVGGSVIGMVLAAIAFLIVLAAIGWGIYEVYQIGHPPVKK